jgi:PAS domain-containing protein
MTLHARRFVSLESCSRIADPTWLVQVWTTGRRVADNRAPLCDSTCDFSCDSIWEDPSMIIRLLRGRVAHGQEVSLVTRLRGLGRDGRGPLAGFAGATFGFRPMGRDLGFVALSTWQTIEAIAAATAGDPDAPLPAQLPGRELIDPTIDLFEVADESPLGIHKDAAALGLIWARVAPHAESAAHDMIRASEPLIVAAGVRALHVGRRVAEGRTELLAVAAWRDRLALHEFAQQRTGGAIDPAFLSLLTDWRFETYDCLAPGSLHLALRGPAVLLADDAGRYLDASPAIEGLIGLPAELILGRTLADLTPPDVREAVAGAWSSFLAAGSGEGTFELLRPDGAIAPVSYRAIANCPAPGIHASVLAALGEPVDPRPVIEIVNELFPFPRVAVA